MKVKKIAAVIVLYNPNEQYLNIINEINDLVEYIFLVDNSENNKKIKIPKNKKIKYLKNETNLGIAKALNQGANEAIKCKCNWLLTMDQDSEMTSSILFELKKFLDNNTKKNIGLITPYHDIEGFSEKLTENVEEKIEVMTSGNLINLNAYQEIGGFKDWLFIDCVDIEYGMNLNIHNYKVLRLNYLKMKHKLGDTRIHNFFRKKVICSNHNHIRRYYMVRNNLYINDLYREYYPEYCKFLLDVQKGQLKRVIFFEKNKYKKLKFMIKGYFDYKRKIVGKLKQEGK